MIFAEIAFAFAVALFFAVFFYYLMKNRGPWQSFLVFFILVFLAVVFARKWFMPVGPVMFDIHWISLLLIALIFSLLIASSATFTPKGQEGESKVYRGPVNPDIFFWILIFILLFMIIAGYAQISRPVVV